MILSLSSKRSWLAVLLLGVGATVGYFLLPSALLQSVFYPFVSLSCGIIILLAARRKTDSRIAWRCFGAGLLCWAAGDMIWAIYGLLGKVAPYPSIADVLYLAGYLPLIAGVIIYVTGRRRGSLLRSAMDVALIAVPVGLIVWELVFLPYIQSAASGDLFGLLYPLLDLVLFGVAFTLIISPRQAGDSRLLGVAIVFLLVADTLYSTNLLAGTYHAASWYDGGWLISYVVWAAAALHPSAELKVQKLAVGSDEDWHMLLAFAAVTALIGIFSYDVVWGDGGAARGPEFIFGAGVTILLAIARMYMEVRGARRSEARVGDLMDHASDAIFVVENGRYVEVNREACSMTGYSREELLAMEVETLRPFDHTSSLADAFLPAGAGATVTSNSKLVRKDGSLITIESSAHRLPDGRFQSISRDISTRVEAERVQREGEELLRHAFDAGASGMVLETLGGEFIRVNQAFADMLGYDPAELVGMDATSVTHPDDRGTLVGPLSQMASGHISEFHADKRYLHRDGHEVSARVDLALARDAEGEPRLAVAHILDTSHSRELEGRLRQSEKMEAVGQLAGGVAHDFNNILAVIMNYAEFVGETLDEGHEGHSDLSQIIKAGERGAELVHQLLAFSRQEVIQPSAINVAEVIEGMAVLLGRSVGEDVSLSIVSDAQLPNTMADRGQIEQILLNLVVNARDAMPAGGRISISTTDVTLESGMREGLAAGRYVCLTVADTGTGIEPAVLQHIFEPFFTTKPRGEGTGLGLATVYGIVKRAQGGIYADSEKGVSTAFVVYLPETHAEMPAPVASAPASATDRSATILVVEDEDPVRELIARILRREGFDVVDAPSGAEGLDICAARTGKIDLLLTDVVMPLMSGPELRDLVYPIRPEMRVLFMSGYTDDLIAKRGVLAAGDDLLSKPFNSEQLLVKVREALSSDEGVSEPLLEPSR